MSYNMKQTRLICLLLLNLTALCSAQVTNPYHFQREFVPLTYSNTGTPTAYQIIMGARALTGIVGPTNIIVVSNETYATEYEGFSWGYESPVAAWTSAYSVYQQYYQIHSNVFYDNAGYIKGTREAYDTWGAFVWYLQNTITFTSSVGTTYVSPYGVTSEIASVLVGTLGDYCPQTKVTEVGPSLDTNYPGSEASTNYIAGPDITAYYKLVLSTYLRTNTDDSDNDGIPGFADGFDLSSTNSADDLSANDYFTSWQVQLSGYANPTQALIRFTYNASDPANVTQTATGYVAAAGNFRLWHKQASKARNKTSLLSGGDYIPPDTYAATSLGYSVSTRIVDIFIEAVQPGTNQQIVIEVDPDGNGPKDFVCTDKMNIAPVSLNLLSAQTNTINSLSVARWEDAFIPGTPPTLKTNFIDLDIDRFFVRVIDPALQGSGTNMASIRTFTSELSGYSDNLTTIPMAEHPANSGVFISESMLLVSDSIDDAYSSNSLPDDSHGDQTHVTLATGDVLCEYRPTGKGWVDLMVPAYTDTVKQVSINVVIMRLTTNGTPVIDSATVHSNLVAISERYAQSGISIHWIVTTNDPPPDVNLTDGLLVRTNVSSTFLASEAQALIAGCGTVSNLTDVHIFYVDTVDVGGGAGTLGTAVAGYYYDPVVDPYTFNAFVEGSSLLSGYPFVLAHELGHLLTDAAHVSYEWNLMYPYADPNNSLVAAKRLLPSQIQIIRSDSHVQ